jgi:hypothetical protein
MAATPLAAWMKTKSDRDLLAFKRTAAKAANKSPNNKFAQQSLADVLAELATRGL